MIARQFTKLATVSTVEYGIPPNKISMCAPKYDKIKKNILKMNMKKRNILSLIAPGVHLCRLEVSLYHTALECICPVQFFSPDHVCHLRQLVVQDELLTLFTSNKMKAMINRHST